MRFIYFIALLCLVSCELPSDGELREDIVGTWEGDGCNYPYVSDGNSTYPFPVGTITFRINGSYIQQNQDIMICRDSCGIDSTSTSVSYDYCTCSWSIENGRIIIHGSLPLTEGFFDVPIPIEKLNDDCFVLGEFDYYGSWINENACFIRK